MPLADDLEEEVRPLLAERKISQLVTDQQIWCGVSLPDTFSTLRHMINSLNQMAFIFFPAEHDVKAGSLYTPP